MWLSKKQPNTSSPPKKRTDPNDKLVNYVRPWTSMVQGHAECQRLSLSAAKELSQLAAQAGIIGHVACLAWARSLPKLNRQARPARQPGSRRVQAGLPRLVLPTRKRQDSCSFSKGLLLLAKDVAKLGHSTPHPASSIPALLPRRTSWCRSSASRWCHPPYR